MKKRVHVIISGKVHDVNFRNEMKKQVVSLEITGWVRNNADGTVEAVLEGSEENLLKILQFCREGPSRAIVNKVEEEWWEFLEGFRDFRILY